MKKTIANTKDNPAHTELKQGPMALLRKADRQEGTDELESPHRGCWVSSNLVDSAFNG